MTVISTVLLVSNLQFLDNALPVLRLISQNKEKQKLILVFSEEHSLLTAGPNHPLLQIAQNIADEIWFPIGGRWRLVSKNDKKETFVQLARKSTPISRYAFRYRAKRLFENAFFMHKAGNLVLDFSEISRVSYFLAAAMVMPEKIICLAHGEPRMDGTSATLEGNKVIDKENFQKLTELEAPLGAHVFMLHTENLTNHVHHDVSVTKLDIPPRLDSGWLDYISLLYRNKKVHTELMQLKPYGVFFSRPHHNNKHASYNPSPALQTKLKVLNEVRRALELEGLTPVFVKHPHERVQGLDLSGWVTGLNVHNLYLLQYASATFSFGTSLAADSEALGIKMIDYRPDDIEGILRETWNSYSRFVSSREELRACLRHSLTNRPTAIEKNQPNLKSIAKSFSRQKSGKKGNR